MQAMIDRWKSLNQHAIFCAPDQSTLKQEVLKVEEVLRSAIGAAEKGDVDPLRTTWEMLTRSMDVTTKRVAMYPSQDSRMETHQRGFAFLAMHQAHELGKGHCEQLFQLIHEAHKVLSQTDKDDPDISWRPLYQSRHFVLHQNLAHLDDFYPEMAKAANQKAFGGLVNMIFRPEFLTRLVPSLENLKIKQIFGTNDIYGNNTNYRDIYKSYNIKSDFTDEYRDTLKKLIFSENNNQAWRLFQIKCLHVLIAMNYGASGTAQKARDFYDEMLREAPGFKKYLINQIKNNWEPESENNPYCSGIEMVSQLFSILHHEALRDLPLNELASSLDYQKNHSDELFDADFDDPFEWIFFNTSQKIGPNFHTLLTPEKLSGCLQILEDQCGKDIFSSFNSAYINDFLMQSRRLHLDLLPVLIHQAGWSLDRAAKDGKRLEDVLDADFYEEVKQVVTSIQSSHKAASLLDEIMGGSAAPKP